MERLWVVLELTAEVVHPLDVVFAVSDVESTWIEALSESLAFDEAVKDLVHRYLSLELLVYRTDTLNEVLSKRSLWVSVSVRSQNCSLVLEGATGRTVAKFTVFCVAEELGGAIFALMALEGERSTLAQLLGCRSFRFRGEGQVDKFLLSGLLGGGREAEGRWRIGTF